MAKKKLINQSLRGAVYVNEGDGLVHSYDIYHNDEDQTLLKYSAANSLWSEHVRGDVAGLLHDDGNMVMITIGDEYMGLDYAQIEILTALIMACNSTEMELREHRITASLKPFK